MKFSDSNINNIRFRERCPGLLGPRCRKLTDHSAQLVCNMATRKYETFFSTNKLQTLQTRNKYVKI
jgi:hypothetical protein